MSTDLRAGDRVTWTGLRDAPGTVIEYGRPTRVKFDGDAQVHNLPVDELRRVPVTAEHVGRWARLNSAPAGPGRIESVKNSTVWVEYPDGWKSSVSPVSAAVLVADPDLTYARHLAPAPAFPFVGARAQVTIAEWDDGTPSRLSAGDVGTLTGQTHDSTDWIVQRGDGRYGYVAARHLSPVPVSPGPDQPTEHEDWWVSADSDRVVASGSADAVAMFASPEDAARAVAAVNAEAGLRAENQRLTDDLAQARGQRDQHAAGVLAVRQEAETLRAERDAARAELAAAHNTDGLGLPQVGPVVRADYAWLDDDGHRVAELAPASHLRLDAAWALAVAKAATDEERALLADEATTEDKEHDR